MPVSVVNSGGSSGDKLDSVSVEYPFLCSRQKNPGAVLDEIKKRNESNKENAISYSIVREATVRRQYL